VAAIARYGMEADRGYISTGGGAFPEVLEGKTLAAFEIHSQGAARDRYRRSGSNRSPIRA